ncbi:unnamed protein product [Prorocentrum cordatum]|nr:unnamed protein product [Polarella glacialis]
MAATAKPGMPAIGQLVHDGRVLTGSATLEAAGIQEGSLVVAVPAKAPAPPAPAAPPSELAAAPSEAAAALLCDLGFQRPAVERCLRAAGGDPSLALESLMSGTRAPGAPEPLAPAPQASSCAGPLEALRGHPAFQQLRAAVQQQPHALSRVLCGVHRTEPGLIALITEHQQEFVDMLQEPLPVAPAGSGGAMCTSAATVAAAPQAVAHPAAFGAAPQPPKLSAKDQQAVQDLQDLGFSRQQALEAYLACERNQEVAANRLFENAGG